MPPFFISMDGVNAARVHDYMDVGARVTPGAVTEEVRSGDAQDKVSSKNAGNFVPYNFTRLRPCKRPAFSIFPPSMAVIPVLS
jgi:hypothetical protein